MNRSVKNYLSQIGQKGGRKSRRELSSQDARQMVKVREAKKAYKLFYAQCFWSYDPAYKISGKDLEWVAGELMKNGNRIAYEIGYKLCR